MAVRLREKIFRRWLWRLPPHSGAVALTFDDGPDAQTTPSLLAELARLGIVSTHFLVGERAAAAPSLVEETRAAGHAVANHSFQHKSFLWRPGTYQEESLRAADAILTAGTGERCSFFRPCFGQYNNWTQGVLERLGYAGVLWSVIASDWTEQTDEQLWQRLQPQLHEGAIIVLHDGHPTTARVVRLLPRLADEVGKRGWTFVPLLPSTFISGNNT
ncbi:MAG TPA: polysaccharide deacetylase family protein [bacterium]|jgi:peptidoglycan/xylan/chitin deacetylase (PgdA/CDA1 family)